jgi:hypothetical protein
MLHEDLCYLPAIELAAAIRTRRLSPVELTVAILKPHRRAQFQAQRLLHSGS